MKKIFLFIFLLFFVSLDVKAEATDMAESSANVDLWEKFKDNFSNAWNGPDKNILIPVSTWHNRLAYDKEKIDEYNEMPWGIGYGNSRYDQDGDWHAVYAMVFKDSNYHPQTIFGYAFIKNWEINDNPDFRIGAGFTLSLTQREDYAYIPVPLPLPMAAIEYKKFAVQAAYVPGVKNNGNVLFTWLKWQL